MNIIGATPFKDKCYKLSTPLPAIDANPKFKGKKGMKWNVFNYPN